MFRHPDKLKELKSSRFRSRLRSRTNEEELRALVASPEWGYTRRTHERTPDCQRTKIKILKQELMLLKTETRTMKMKYSSAKHKLATTRAEFDEIVTKNSEAQRKLQ
jgi:hypothetical protein